MDPMLFTMFALVGLFAFTAIILLIDSLVARHYESKLSPEEREQIRQYKLKQAQTELP